MLRASSAQETGGSGLTKPCVSCRGIDDVMWNFGVKSFCAAIGGRCRLRGPEERGTELVRGALKRPKKKKNSIYIPGGLYTKSWDSLLTIQKNKKSQDLALEVNIIKRLRAVR